MKTVVLFLGVLALCLGACGPAFTSEFTGSGTADAGEAGDTATPTPAADAGAAGDDTPSEAHAGTSQAGAAGSGGSISAAGASGHSDGPSAGAGSAPSAITPPCEATDDLSGYHYQSFLTPAGGECLRTKETFNVLRLIGCTSKRDIRINGGPALHCTSEPSTAWSSVCSVKGNFSQADADGYHYLQFGSDEYACGPMIWSSEPAGEPCASQSAFAYDKGAAYQTSDRVVAPCEDDGLKACEFRCMDAHCSGMNTPKTPKWELVQACPS